MVGQTLRESLVHAIQELYSAEQHQVRLFARLARAVANVELREALRLHAKETTHQVRRLERAFSLMDEPVRWTRCPGMLGLLEECEETLDGAAPNALQDAGLVAALQRLEHYEMAAYGTAAGWAEVLGLHPLAALLNESLDEEVATADELLGIGLRDVHVAAARVARPRSDIPPRAAQRL